MRSFSERKYLEIKERVREKNGGGWRLLWRVYKLRIKKMAHQESGHAPLCAGERLG